MHPPIGSLASTAPAVGQPTEAVGQQVSHRRGDRRGWGGQAPERRRQPRPTNVDELLRHLPARALLDRMPAPAIGVGHDGTLVYANPACASLLGYVSTHSLNRGSRRCSRAWHTPPPRTASPFSETPATPSSSGVMSRNSPFIRPPRRFSFVQLTNPHDLPRRCHRTAALDLRPSRRCKPAGRRLNRRSIDQHPIHHNQGLNAVLRERHAIRPLIGWFPACA